MRTFKFKSDAKLPESVEAFPAEIVDEHLATDGVVALRDEDLLLFGAEDTFLDKMVEDLTVCRVHFTAKNCLVPVKKSGNALPRSGHLLRPGVFAAVTKLNHLKQFLAMIRSSV